MLARCQRLFFLERGVVCPRSNFCLSGKRDLAFWKTPCYPPPFTGTRSAFDIAPFVPQSDWDHQPYLPALFTVFRLAS